MSNPSTGTIVQQASPALRALPHRCRPTRVADFRRSRVVEVRCEAAWNAPYVPPAFRFPCGALTPEGRLLVDIFGDDGPEAA